MIPKAELISTGAAARRLGVHIRTMQRWTEAGHLTPDYVTPGGHRRWDLPRLVRDNAAARLATQRRVES